GTIAAAQLNVRTSARYTRRTRRWQSARRGRPPSRRAGCEGANPPTRAWRPPYDGGLAGRRGWVWAPQSPSLALVPRDIASANTESSSRLSAWSPDGRRRWAVSLNPPTQYLTDANLRARQRLWEYQRPRLDLVSWVLAVAGLRATSTARVLDVGCGNGIYLAQLRHRGIDVVGCD